MVLFLFALRGLPRGRTVHSSPSRWIIRLHKNQTHTFCVGLAAAWGRLRLRCEVDAGDLLPARWPSCGDFTCTDVPFPSPYIARSALAAGLAKPQPHRSFRGSSEKTAKCTPTFPRQLQFIYIEGRL